MSSIGSTPKCNGFFISLCYPSTKSHGNRPRSFSVILLADKQTAPKPYYELNIYVPVIAFTFLWPNGCFASSGPLFPVRMDQASVSFPKTRVANSRVKIVTLDRLSRLYSLFDMLTFELARNICDDTSTISRKR